MTGSGKRPLKIGIMLPESEREMVGDTAGWPDILAMARATERLGFDSLWFADHLLMQVPGHDRQGAWDAWSMLAALAAVTERIEIAPLVACTAYRNPALTAKIAETVDEISGGRLIQGLGAGWAEPEYRSFGYPYDRRFSRFEEAFTIIRKLIREGSVDFPGAYGRPGQAVPSFAGSAEELAEEMRAYAREGISHVQIYPDPCTVAGIEAFAPVLEILDQA